MDRAPSLDARAAVARERLEWHASLSSLLEGDFAREDWELAVSLARSRAQDLTEQAARRAVGRGREEEGEQ